MLRPKLVASIVFTTVLSVLLTLSASADSFADPAFGKVWEKTDKSVTEGSARTWMWGPAPLAAIREAYGESSGDRLVQYFDKGRMEITNPFGDRNSPLFVSGGLLVKEMIAGKIQVGDALFSTYIPAQIPLVGDLNRNSSPTYASLRFVASLNNDRRVPNKVNQLVTEAMDASGVIGQREGMDAGAVFATYDETMGHNIPDVFWSFLTNPEAGKPGGSSEAKNSTDWIYISGYPLTEPYWIWANVAGEEKEVLVQAFERRILTFTPNSSRGWQVEMGNVGQHYYIWRHLSTLAPGAPYEVYNPFSRSPYPWGIQVTAADRVTAPVGGTPSAPEPQIVPRDAFVVVQVRAKNLETRPMAIEADDFVLRDASGREFTMDSSGGQSGDFPGYKGHLAGWTVQPGQTGEYALVFEVPQDAAGLVFAPRRLDQPAVSLGM